MKPANLFWISMTQYVGNEPILLEIWVVKCRVDFFSACKWRMENVNGRWTIRSTKYDLPQTDRQLSSGRGLVRGLMSVNWKGHLNFILMELSLHGGKKTVVSEIKWVAAYGDSMGALRRTIKICLQDYLIPNRFYQSETLIHLTRIWLIRFICETGVACSGIGPKMIISWSDHIFEDSCQIFCT